MSFAPFTKPVDQLMVDGRISVYWQSFRRTGHGEFGQPTYEYGVSWWVAESRKLRGEGESPRLAIIDLYKNASHP